MNFAQTVGLVSLLRAHNAHELFVMPDDTHETLLYKRWVLLWEHGGLLNKYLKKEDVSSTQQQQK